MLLRLLTLLGLLLADDLASVEFNEHRSVSVELLDGDREAKVVEEEELELEVIEFD